jgi:hypothetical protein
MKKQKNKPDEIPQIEELEELKTFVSSKKNKVPI